MVGDKAVFLNVGPPHSWWWYRRIRLRDVYLAPLIEELQKLWEGIDAVDASAENVNRKFTLKVILMWCIHDFPAYGLVSGQVTKGYRGCPECGPSVTTRRSAMLTNNVYLGHRRFLNRTHPYRRLQGAFDGSQEIRPPQRELSGRDIVRYAVRRETWLADSPQNKPKGLNDPIHDTCEETVCIFCTSILANECLDPN